MKNTPDGGLVTGLKVAVAGKILQRHPFLRTGAVAGIVASEAESAFEQSTAVITDTVLEIARAQTLLAGEQHEKILATSERLTELTKTLVNAQHDTQQDVEQRQATTMLKATVETSREYQKSREVISDAELYVLLQHLTETHQNDFQRANPSNPDDLWRYRAAMTFALGPDHDYGIDVLPYNETVLDDLTWDFETGTNRVTEIKTIKPKTTILNLLRQEYLQTLAKHLHELI
jgi:hypothetical protein